MNSVKQACALNNEGVAFLVDGKPTLAMRNFQSGLAVLKQVVNEFDEDADEDLECSMSAFPSKSPIRESRCVPLLQSQDCYIYDHGLMLEEPACDKIDDVFSTYSAVILFNLALASHLEGKLGHESSLKRASLLYKMCPQLLENCDEPDNASSMVLTLLALNNRAQIQYSQCDYREADTCIRDMSCIMADNKSLDVSLAHKDFEGLMLNVMLLNTPTAAQAA